MEELTSVLTSESSSFIWQIVALILLLLVLVLGCLCLHLWKKLHSVPIAYADCMVDTYVYGYLRKIIPDHGFSEERGLKNKIMHYKDIQGLSDEEFPFNKMFILIPASGYIPPLLDKLDQPGRIEIRKPLEPLILNRAGVDSREYKSAVYKIFFRGEISKHITVAMEGAPPLLCLSDSCKENPELSKYKKELIYLFYKKLKAKIKEHEEFEDSCEPIYYEEGSKSLADYLILRYIEGK